MSTNEHQLSSPQDLKNWSGSSISLMGDTTKPRSVFKNIVVGAMVALVLVKTGIAASNGHLGGHHRQASNIEQPLYKLEGSSHEAFSKITSSMDKSGQTINKMYGDDHLVFIWKDDSNLKEVLDKTNPRFLENMPYTSILSDFRSIKEGYLENYGSHADLLKANAYDNLTSYHAAESWTAGKVADQNDPSVQDSVILVNPSASEAAFTSSNTTFPRVTVAAEHSYASFFGEIARGVNHSVNNREAANVNYSTHAGATEMLMEVNIDASYALLALKHTGNLDEWNNNLKPVRMTTVDNNVKMTTEVVDQVLKGVSYEDVRDLSDKQIMALADAKSDAAITGKFSNIHDRNSADPSKIIELVHSIYLSKAQGDSIDNRTYSDAVWDLKNLVGGEADSLVKNYSLSAMESSINNLAYHGKLQENEGSFIKAVERHASDYNDPSALAALKASTVDGHLDFKKFAQLENMKVDFDSHARLEQNVAKMSAHMNEVLGKSPVQDMAVSKIETNLSGSVQDRYAAKSLASARPEVKQSSHLQMNI